MHTRDDQADAVSPVGRHPRRWRGRGRRRAANSYGACSKVASMYCRQDVQAAAAATLDRQKQGSPAPTCCTATKVHDKLMPHLAIQGGVDSVPLVLHNLALHSSRQAGSPHTKEEDTQQDGSTMLIGHAGSSRHSSRRKLPIRLQVKTGAMLQEDCRTCAPACAGPQTASAQRSRSRGSHRW